MRFESVKKILFSVVLISPSLVFSQSSSNPNEERVFIPDAQKGAQVFKHARLLEPQSETVEISGLGSPLFAASNLVDGTVESYNHKVRVTYSLQVTGGKGSYQLVFYMPNEKMPYSVNTENGVTTVYMPFQLHDYFKSKVEQNITARKKVQLKLNLSTSGLREAVWVL
ncbi:MAG: hypothetical protein RLZ05_196 [Bacteroidota bacterium]|jgi:hypothetical protein